MVFEDLHWIDSETQALLNLIVDGIATARILLLVNYRPEYSHQWGNKTYYTRLRLDPLGKESADEMLAALLGADAELPPLKRLIIERTEGNPFFMEEMVQALFEQGVLVRNGAVKLVRPLHDIRVPPTVQAILASRIDRLAAAEKELLQTLAVLGREFPLGLIKQVTGKSDDELERMLSELRLAEFIYEQPAFPDIEYIFKHALTQEVAYNAVLTERRRLLHERAAQAIEELFADRLEDHLTELARHYDRSGNAPKAVEYLGRAGQRAAQQTAYAEAIGYLTRALGMLKQLRHSADRDRQEVDLLLELGVCLFVARGAGAAEREPVLARATELCEQLGNDAKLAEALLAMAHFRSSRRESREALALAERVIGLAQGPGAPAILGGAHSVMGIVLNYMGQFEPSREHLERAFELFGAEPPRGPLGRSAVTVLPLALVVLGYPATGLKKARDVLASARPLSDPYSIAYALYCEAAIGALLGDSRIAIERSEELLSIASEHGLTLLHALALGLRGWALAGSVRVDEGFTEMRKGVSILPAGAVTTSFFIVLAEACAKHRRPEEGLAAVGEGLTRVEQLGETANEADLYRLKGELLLICDPADEVQAQHCFRTAIDIACRQKAKWWELRATISLAGLLQKQGKTAEAGQMLTDIYTWFTEGFDTAYLKEAKALLDELAR